GPPVRPLSRRRPVKGRASPTGHSRPGLKTPPAASPRPALRLPIGWVEDGARKAPACRGPSHASGTDPEGEAAVALPDLRSGPGSRKSDGGRIRELTKARIDECRPAGGE